MSRVGTLLRGMRLARQLDLAAMADQLATAPRRLELVEMGAAFPSAAERRAWADKLGFTDLLDFDRHWRDGWPGVTLAGRDGSIPIINKTPAGKPVDYQEYGIDSSVGYEYVPRSAGTKEIWSSSAPFGPTNRSPTARPSSSASPPSEITPAHSSGYGAEPTAR